MSAVDYRYVCTVVRVIDGDSFEALFDLGFKVSLRETVRLAGIDTPEKVGRSKARGLAAKAFVEGLLPAGTAVLVQTFKGRDEKFGRFLASVTLPDGTDLVERLIAAGHGVPYDGGKR